MVLVRALRAAAARSRMATCVRVVDHCYCFLGPPRLLASYARRSAVTGRALPLRRPSRYPMTVTMPSSRTRVCLRACPCCCRTRRDVVVSMRDDVAYRSARGERRFRCLARTRDRCVPLRSDVWRRTGYGCHRCLGSARLSTTE